MHSNKMNCIDYINDNGFEVKPNDDYSIMLWSQISSHIQL
jgi:hypothetical protein